MARDITTEEIATVAAMLDRARKAMDEVSQYDQAQVDRLARALGWACGNETTFVRIAQICGDARGIVDRKVRAVKRLKG